MKGKIDSDFNFFPDMDDEIIFEEEFSKEGDYFVDLIFDREHKIKFLKNLGYRIIDKEDESEEDGGYQMAINPNSEDPKDLPFEDNIDEEFNNCFQDHLLRILLRYGSK